MPLDRTWYSTLVDDDGSNTVGSIWNKASVDHIYDDVDAALVGVVTAGTTELVISASGTFNPLTTTAASRLRYVQIMGASNVTIGNVLPVHNPGEALLIKNAGTGTVTLINGLGSYGLFNLATSAPTPLGSGGSALYYGVDSVWRMVAHEQGTAISTPFNAGNYTVTGGSGTWTVTAGQVGQHQYLLRGRTLTLMVVLSATTLTGTPTVITVNGFGGFTFAATPATPAISSAAVGGWGLVMGTPTGNAVGIGRTDYAAFPAGAIHLYLNITALVV